MEKDSVDKLKSEIKNDNKIVPDANKDISKFKSNLPTKTMKFNGN